MPWSSRPGGEEATVQSTTGRDTEFWNTFSYLMSEEEIVDYIFYLKEATNAYATELTWALVIVLGGTCLYIYRLLGQQEAARVHLQMANCRPVFSSKPVQNSPSSTFLVAYKNRFAHKDTKNPVEERVNAVGYDVLHRYNKSAYHDCLVPRAVWKRHNSGHDPEPAFVQHQGGDRSWDQEASNNRSWSGTKKPHQTGLYSAVHTACVPVAPHRSQYRTISLEGNNLKQQQQHQKLHQQEVKMVPGQIGYHSPHNASVSESTRPPPKLSAVPPPQHAVPAPIPAPRCEETVGVQGKEHGPIAKPRQKSLSPLYKNKPQTQGEVLVTGKAMPVSRKKIFKPVEYTSDSETSSDSSNYKNCHLREYPYSKKRKSITKPHLKAEVQPKKKGAETTPTKDKTKHIAEAENLSKKKNTKADNMLKQPDILQTAQKESQTDIKSSLLKDPQQIVRIRSHSEIDLLERLRNKLLSEDNILDRYHTASSFLDNFSKLYAESRLQQLQLKPKTDAGPEFEQKKDMQTEDTTEKHADTLGIEVNPKHGMTTIQKSDSPSRILSPGTDKAKGENIHKYDSPVLRAVKAEEESMKAEKETQVTEQEPGTQCFIDEITRKAAGDTGEPGKEDSMHECERRLANIRMRMEDSFGKVPSSPDPEKMTIDNFWSVKDIQVPEKGSQTIKDDILELDSLVTANMFISANDKKESQISEKSIARANKLVDHTRSQSPEVAKLMSFTPASVAASYYSSDALLAQAERVTSFLEIIDSSRRHAKSATTLECDQLNRLSAQEISRTMPTLQEMISTAQETVPETDTLAETKAQELKIAARSEEQVRAWKEKLMDEDTLDEILERQRARKENLKMKRSGLHSHSRSSEIAATVEKLSKNDMMRSAENKFLVTAEQPTKQYNIEHHINKVKESPNSLYLLDTASNLSEADTALNNELQNSLSKTKKPANQGTTVGIVKNRSPTPFTTNVSLSYLNNERPNVTHEPIIVETDKTTMLMERDSSTRRRVRWRRLIERAEKHHTAETVVVPPPVPPKITRLSDISSLSACSPVDSMIVKSDMPIENNVENLYDGTQSPHRQASPLRNVKGFNIYVSNPHLSLAAGETGLVKSTIKVHPETGICEEKSLTPSKAAAIFDPKVQRERELQKQEAERKARTTSLNRQGLSSPQFKANVSIFERASVAECEDTRNVKANVEMFESVNRAQRCASLSPERRTLYTVRVSRSPLRPTVSPPGVI